MAFGRGLYLKILVIPLVFFALGVAIPGYFGYRLVQRNSDRSVRVIEEDTNLGRKFHVIAKPTVASESCLKCHGDPAAAPTKKREEFSRTEGFNWRKGQVVGATVIYVPKDYVQSQGSNIFW